MKIIRYGGDEFILCIKHQQKDYIKTLVNNTHAYLLTLKLEQEHQSYPLKVSMGACVNDQQNYQYKELFERADSCLYEAKDNGRASYVLCELS